MSSDPTSSIKRRRELLKAAVGAPAIFTLSSGSAQAARSFMCESHVANNVSVSHSSVVNGASENNAFLGVGETRVVDGQAYVVAGVAGGESGDPTYSLVTASCWASISSATTASADSLSGIA